MSRTLYIVGTGGLAKEVGQLAYQIDPARSRWSSVEYLCEREEDVGTPMPFGKVTGTDKLLYNLDRDADYVIGIGTPKVRQRIAEGLRGQARLTAPNLIHPSAGLDTDSVHLGQGNIVTRGVVFTCDIVVGDHNVFNWNVTVGHDVRIGSYCVINPGSNVSGHVLLGDTCLALAAKSSSAFLLLPARRWAPGQ
jgi:NDP-sugar pyrophosphorylase family protein